MDDIASPSSEILEKLNKLHRLTTYVKIVNFTALKCTNSFIIPDELAAYTEFNPDRKIDAYLSALGVSKRMTADIIKVGSLTKILIEKKRYFKDKYGERIKNELKKK